ncbi:3089_t:CDS:2 [Acaulospora morrowiae]|uniref:3089_t:CDS:1 n=1 Tax=Acaulospora morrowiae TaxID=94023 RepID=A0A9N9CBH1_9GLOM|nr:3089_t:CDS:2 [Acaulospora morrowiae]
MGSSPSSYPLKGIGYFFSHWILVRRIIFALLLTLVVSVIAIVLTFGIFLALQTALLTAILIPPPIAFIIAFILCIIESTTFVFIFYTIATPFWQDSLFDEVLRLRGLGPVLDKPRQASGFVLCFRGFKSGFEIIVIQVFFLIITLPIHSIPILGSVAYCFINGWPLAWSLQAHYHIDIKELTSKQSRKFAWENRKDYIWFGAVGIFLGLIPVLNLIFFWTNIVGAALWTSDVLIEEQKLKNDSIERSVNTDAVGTSYQAATNMEGSAITATAVKTYGATDNA